MMRAIIIQGLDNMKQFDAEHVIVFDEGLLVYRYFTIKPAIFIQTSEALYVNGTKHPQSIFITGPRPMAGKFQSC